MFSPVATPRGLCRVIVALSIFSFPVHKTAADTSGMLLSPASAAQALSEGAVLVDVRPAKDFADFRIPGSQNHPLFALKAKNHLKPLKVILLNRGFPATPLEQECLRLRVEGWQTFILDGGLRRWEADGFPIERNNSSDRHLDRIDPSDFVAEEKSGRWIVLEDDGDEEAFRKLAIQTRGKSSLPIIIVNEHGNYDGIRSSLKKMPGLGDVLYLSGGRAGLNSFHSSQEAMKLPGVDRAGDAGDGCAPSTEGTLSCR